MVDLFLRNIRTAYGNKDLNKLQRLLNQLLDFAVIPNLEIKSNVSIQRLRNNYKGELFTSEDEISFRKDFWNIKEFGRCNFPNSPKFYGSLSSKYINEIRVVNVLETNKEFRQNKIVRKRQIFTSGEWVTIKPSKVAIFPFYQSAISQNEEVKLHAKEFNSIIENIPHEPKIVSRKVLSFISYYFSLKKISSPFDYAISAYLTEMLIDRYGYDGVLYPSVRAGYKAYNVVLTPTAVISNLDFKKAAMFELYINKKNVFIENLAYGDITNDKKIYWNYTERTSEKELNNFFCPCWYSS